MSIAQSIFDTLVQSGMTKEAALGMMGNMKCESGLEANRVQNDFSPFRTVSKAYVARLSSGEMSRETFAKDSLGFGLCQWTFYSRKWGLYDYWKESGLAIDDPVMQTRYAVIELKQDHRYLWEELLVNHDIYTCTKLICEQFERPAHNNIDQRYQAALAYRDELAPREEPEPNEDLSWPPRTLEKGMSGDDVLVLKAILRARGFKIGKFTGTFSNTVKCSVLAFQAETGLDTDGIVGPVTWKALLEWR